jgi:hypothetical protein
VKLACSPSPVSRLSGQCDILNISQPCRSPRPVTAITFCNYSPFHNLTPGTARDSPTNVACSAGVTSYQVCITVYIHYIYFSGKGNNGAAVVSLEAKLIPEFFTQIIMSLIISCIIFYFDVRIDESCEIFRISLKLKRKYYRQLTEYFTPKFNTIFRKN